jgi:hypothetical protein
MYEATLGTVSVKEESVGVKLNSYRNKGSKRNHCTERKILWDGSAERTEHKWTKQ